MTSRQSDSLQQLLHDHQTEIKDQWLDLIVNTYPADTSRFLMKQKDRFMNPVGYTLKQAVQDIFVQLRGDMDREKLAASLDDLIKIRSVQEFCPSEALQIIFLLKTVIRRQFQEELKHHHMFLELLAFESRIDQVMLLSFDKYVRCREKIYEIKALELKNRHYKLIERMNIFKDDEDSTQD